ncbi:MAG: glycosyltransferase family 39 protein [Dokdonella sp.]
MSDLISTSLSASRQRREFWLFLLIALIVLGAGIGLRDPWPADEPRFTLVAKHMVESGDWLITHRGSELYSDKPPMFMAMQAAAYTMIGSWRIAFLLPSLLAALGTLALVYDLARRLWNHRTALWAGAALLATFQFVYQAKRAQIDPSVMFFITLANYGMLRHFLLGPDWRAYWLGCFAAGLGVITKGVGVLALLMFLPYLFARWRDWPAVRWPGVVRNDRAALRWLGGALAFLAAIALWLVPMLISVSSHNTPEYHAYLNDILFHQTAGRYAESWDHQQPVWYYIGVIATSWLPVVFTLPGTIPRWRERLVAHDARILLPLAWIVLVVLFFTFPVGKRDVYIMPALPLFAMISAPFLDDLSQRAWLRRILFGFVLLLGLLFLIGGIAAWSGHWPRANLLVEQRGLEGGGVALWGFVTAIGAIALSCALVFRIRRSVIGLAITFTALWLLWGFWAYPVLNDSTSAVGVMHRAGELIGPDAELGMVAWKEQNLLMADRPATDFGFVRPWHEQLADSIRWQEQAPANRWIFILDEAMGPCIDRDRAVDVGHANRREWWLFREEAVMPDCRGGHVPTPSETNVDDPNAG